VEEVDVEQEEVAEQELRWRATNGNP